MYDPNNPAPPQEEGMMYTMGAPATSGPATSGMADGGSQVRRRSAVPAPTNPMAPGALMSQFFNRLNPRDAPVMTKQHTPGMGRHAYGPGRRRRPGEPTPPGTTPGTPPVTPPGTPPASGPIVAPGAVSPPVTNPAVPSQGDALAGWADSAGHDFLLNQGVDTIYANNAASGYLQSGATGTALEDYRYNLNKTYLNDYMGHTLDLAKLGLGAGAGMSSAGGWESGSGFNSSGTYGASNSQSQAQNQSGSASQSTSSGSSTGTSTSQSQGSGESEGGKEGLVPMLLNNATSN
jgi:hypothetical protein